MPRELRNGVLDIKAYETLEHIVARKGTYVNLILVHPHICMYI
jgi:hypothetical protein